MSDELADLRAQVAELKAQNKALRDVHVTDEMTSAGMREWDLAMKEGERHWPVMLTRVFTVMYRAALATTRADAPPPEGTDGATP